MKITRDTLVCEALKINKKSVRILEENKMGFLLCPTSQLDTLEEAAKKHGANIDEILDIFNQKSYR
ncbi:MAG: hypothetical protein PWQ37_1078 [Candidatus Petromonas sp.]|jgi:hybrid cluster-associated redox disulfide protein|nr:hypothetical protein [Candidatus Petromonas sp.]